VGLFYLVKMNPNYLLMVGQGVYVIASFLSSRRIYMRKSSEDFSVTAVLMGYLGVVCLFSYSLELLVTKGVYALFIQNLVNIFMNTINTSLVIYYHPRDRK
jgi:hypothetical protein